MREVRRRREGAHEQKTTLSLPLARSVNAPPPRLLQQGHAPVAGGLRPGLAGPGPQHGHQLGGGHGCACGEGRGQKKKRERGEWGVGAGWWARARTRARVCAPVRARARPTLLLCATNQPRTRQFGDLLAILGQREIGFGVPAVLWGEREKKKNKEGVRGGGGRGREGERGPRPPPPPLSLSVHTLTLLMAARSKARAAATSVSWSPREVVLPPAEIWGERGGAREGKREEREGEVFGLRGGAFPPPQAGPGPVAPSRPPRRSPRHHQQAGCTPTTPRARTMALPHAAPPNGRPHACTGGGGPKKKRDGGRRRRPGR